MCWALDGGSGGRGGALRASGAHRGPQRQLRQDLSHAARCVIDFRHAFSNPSFLSQMASYVAENIFQALSFGTKLDAVVGQCS
jgi:hypothetical protein